MDETCDLCNESLRLLLTRILVRRFGSSAITLSVQCTSAMHLYILEIRQVSGVLDRVLANRDWLVGDRISYADLAFVLWQNATKNMLLDECYDENKFPNVSAWLGK